MIMKKQYILVLLLLSFYFQKYNLDVGFAIKPFMIVGLGLSFFYLFKKNKIYIQSYDYLFLFSFCIFIIRCIFSE